MKTKPPVIKVLTVRVSQTELKHLERISQRKREAKAETIRKAFDQLETGEITLASPLPLQFRQKLRLTHALHCCFFSDQMTTLTKMAKRFSCSRAAVVRGVIRRLPEN